MKQKLHLLSPYVIAAILVVISLVLFGYGLVTDHGAKQQMKTLADKVNATYRQAATQDDTAGQNTDETTQPSSTTQNIPVKTDNTSAVATINTEQLQTILESYFAVYGFYPGSLASAEFGPLKMSSSYSGTDPVAAVKADTTTPAGVSYVYTPTPAGCTTAGNNCTGYTIAAKAADGTVIISKASF